MRLSSLALVLALLPACGSEPDAGSEESNVRVVTSSEQAFAQYLANVELALGYQARCPAPDPAETRPRVLVTGFGRFMDNRLNATGLIVSQLLPELDYPYTEPPAPGAVDPPEPQLAVAHGTVVLPQVGEVDVCAMVLPVFWDLAAVLVHREIEAFAPDLVLMNGIAGERQPLWLELGAINQAAALPDGSGVLAAEQGPVIATAAPSEHGRPNRLSWQAVSGGMFEAIEARAGELHEGESFGSIAGGVLYAGFPRSSNTYLCNNTTYAVGYLMDHPGEPVRLMEATEPREGFPSAVEVIGSIDRSHVPRVFVHWPSALDGPHLAAAAFVIAAGIDAQLAALRDGALPTPGDNAIADLPGDG